MIYTIWDDALVYGFVLPLSMCVGIASLAVNIATSQASKQAVLSFAKSLSPVLRKLYFETFGIVLGYKDVHEFFEEIEKFGAIVARLILSLLIVLLEIIYTYAKLSTAQPLQIGVIVDVGIWVGIYTVTFVASWRFGSKVKNFEESPSIEQ